MESWHHSINDLGLSKDFFHGSQTYAKLLLNYAKTHNITAFKNEKEVFANVVDSVYPLRYLQTKPQSIADIGSGAGFPGLFLALALPKTEVTLYEPLKKKAAFLHLAKSKLGLTKLRIKSKRVEEEKSQNYELIVSRAVTDTKMLLALSKNICTQNTSYLLYKGSSVEDEIDKSINAKIHTLRDRRYVFIKEKQ